MRSSILFVAATIASACAKTIVVTVGGNSTNVTDPSLVFSPQTVIAEENDVVYFNFTHGNHTAIESTFASPCIPAHISNSTLNGFNSGFRDTVNGTAITHLEVVVTNPNDTIWFFDWNTCAEGGVGAINVNESSWETFDGFVRNAMRLNGTQPVSSSSSGGGSATRTSAPSTQTDSSAAGGAIVNGAAVVVPALFALLSLSF